MLSIYFTNNVIDGIKNVAGDVGSFMEDMGPIFADLVVEYGDFLLDGIEQLIEFINFFFTGTYKISYETGKYFEYTVK